MLDVDDLLDRVKVVLRVTKPEDLAYALRGDPIWQKHGQNIDLRKVQRWMSKTKGNAPEYASVIALLEIAGWLSPEALAAANQDSTTRASDAARKMEEETTKRLGQARPRRQQGSQGSNG